MKSLRKLCTPQYLISHAWENFAHLYTSENIPSTYLVNTSSWASENFGTPQDLYNVVRRHVIIPGFQHGQNYDYIYLYPDRKLKYILSTT